MGKHWSLNQARSLKLKVLCPQTYQPFPLQAA